MMCSDRFKSRKVVKSTQPLVPAIEIAWEMELLIRNFGSLVNATFLRKVPHEQCNLIGAQWEILGAEEGR